MKILRKTQNTDVVTSGSIKSHKMTVSSNKLAKLLYIQNDKIYSDKIGACIREHLTNAVEEQELCNVTSPIEITLTESTYKIKDHGRGLDYKKLINHYLQYMESDKSGNSKGGFGLGAKCAHAYTDTYILTSVHKGKKLVVAAIYETPIGNKFPEATGKELLYEDTKEPSGLEIEIPIKKHDYHAFLNKIQYYTYFLNETVTLNGKPLPNYKEALIYENDKFIFLSKKVNIKYLVGNIPYKYKYNTTSKILFKLEPKDITLQVSREFIEETQENQEIIKQYQKELITAKEKLINNIEIKYKNKSLLEKYIMQSQLIDLDFDSNKVNEVLGTNLFEDLSTFMDYTTDRITFYTKEKGKFRISNADFITKENKTKFVFNPDNVMLLIPQNKDKYYSRKITIKRLEAIREKLKTKTLVLIRQKTLDDESYKIQERANTIKSRMANVLDYITPSEKPLEPLEHKLEFLDKNKKKQKGKNINPFDPNTIITVLEDFNPSFPNIPINTKNYKIYSCQNQTYYKLDKKIKLTSKKNIYQVILDNLDESMVLYIFAALDIKIGKQFVNKYKKIQNNESLANMLKFTSIFGLTSYKLVQEIAKYLPKNIKPYMFITDYAGIIIKNEKILTSEQALKHYKLGIKRALNLQIKEMNKQIKQCK